MFFRGQGKGLAVVAILLGMSVARRKPVTLSMPASAIPRVRRSAGSNSAPRIAGDCRGGTSQPRDIVMSQTAWRDLVRVNKWVNETIKPITDMDHWGVIEKWSLPTDGYGDCEDYVLLKRKMLIDAGWPREALLITVVRDKKGEGHAVLTVKSDKGEFVLDNQNETVLAWTETGYRFVKRQSQSDPNVWVSLGDNRPAVATASFTRSITTQRIYEPATRSHPHPSPSQTGSRAASLPPKAGRTFFGVMDRV